jgi:hypothetical protein
MIVHMSHMTKGKLPLRLREASLQSHGFSLLCECPDYSFRTTILLVCMWDTLVDLDPFFFHHVNKSLRGIFPTSVGHPTTYVLLVFGLDHSQEMSCGRESSVFGSQVDGPSV